MIFILFFHLVRRWVGLFGLRLTRVSTVEGKDDAYAQLQSVRSEMTRKTLQYLYKNCHSIGSTQRTDISSLTEALGNMVKIIEQLG